MVLCLYEHTQENAYTKLFSPSDLLTLELFLVKIGHRIAEVIVQEKAPTNP